MTASDVGAATLSRQNKMNEKGFMLLSAVVLTMLLSFTAMISLRSATQFNNDDAALRLHALNLANQQFAMVESFAAQNNLSSVKNFNGNDDDLKSYGLYSDENKTPTEFKVTTSIDNVNENLKKVKVTVTWKDKNLEFEKLVRLKN